MASEISTEAYPFLEQVERSNAIKTLVKKDRKILFLLSSDKDKAKSQQPPAPVAAALTKAVKSSRLCAHTVPTASPAPLRDLL